jgi:hypothetical protein
MVVAEVMVVKGGPHSRRVVMAVACLQQKRQLGCIDMIMVTEANS